MPTSASRAVVARRRQARAEALWAPDKQADRSWMRFVRCKGCGTKLCVNNNATHEVDLSGIERAGGYVWRPGKKKKLVMVLCFRCKRFAKLLRRVHMSALGGDEQAQALWDSYPAKPYPGEA